MRILKSNIWMFEGLWKLLCLSWIIVGLLSQQGDTVFRGECRSEGFFTSVTSNSRLVNYVISTLDVDSLQDCASSCLSDGRCSSYNFQVSGFPLHKCELNSDSRSSARPGSLVRDDGYQYYEATDTVTSEDLCETTGCLNGGTCKENCETFSASRGVCECPAMFTGISCELPKTGNFLLNYNSSTMNDYSSVSVTGADFTYLALYVWVKPSSTNGVVFSYATENNPREMVLLFEKEKVILYLAGQVVNFEVILPQGVWSQLCFILFDKTKLVFYLSLKRESAGLSQQVTIKGSGILVPAFEQISPGIVDVNSGCNITLTRLYIKDESSFDDFEIVRVYNEPTFSKLRPEPFRVDWKEFYNTVTNSDKSAVITPTNEPDIGNYDLRFPDSSSVNLTIPDTPEIVTFALSMWIRVLSTKEADAVIFAIISESDDILILTQKGSVDGYTLEPRDGILTEFFQVISDTRWFHALWYWRSSTGKLLFYKNGNQQYERSDILKQESLPKIINGVAHIGDSNFHGDITGINLWSFELSLNTIVAIALNPGNVAGNIFSWKFVEDAGHAVSAPSKCHNRQGDFDLVFPASSNQMNHISMSTTYTREFKTIAAVFWIRISPSAGEFTLISYSVPNQVNEFNVRFGTTGLWVYVSGSKSFVPLLLSSLVGDWHHFVIYYVKGKATLCVFHNGIKILQTSTTSNEISSRDAILVVGAQQSKHGQIPEPRFQFTGKLSQLQLYRRTFTDNMILTFANRCWSMPGNHFDWTDMKSYIKGDVKTQKPSECLKAKNGET